MTVLVRELGLQEPLDTDKMRRSNRIGLLVKLIETLYVSEYGITSILRVHC